MSNQPYPPYPPRRKSNAWACAGIGCGGCLLTTLLIVGLLVWPFIRHSDIYDAFMDGFKGRTTPRHVMVNWGALAKLKHPYTPNTQVLVVAVMVTNHGYEQVPVKFTDFTLELGGMPCTLAPIPLDNPLPSRSLADGESAEGCIAFEMPNSTPSAAKPELKFHPLVLGRNFEVICRRMEAEEANKGKQ